MGTTFPGYPNYFVSCGPTSGPNHGGGFNIVSECQVHYMIECLDYMLANGARTIEPTQEASERHNQRIRVLPFAMCLILGGNNTVITLL